MRHHERVTAVLKTSHEVLRDCALENGAIVAANTDKSYTPREAADYRAVWPRDAAFISVAAKYLGMPDIGEKFLAWLYEKPERFRMDKLLYQKYSTNGRLDGGQFQADQMGSVLWMIRELYGESPSDAQRWFGLIERLADGLATTWNGRFFDRHVTDLWEQEHLHTSHTMENNFTYTLAASARGLLIAHHYIPNTMWKEAAQQMLEKVDQAYSKERTFFLRNHGKVDDHNVDISLLGLVWPFAVIEPSDERMRSTVAQIEDRLVEHGGVHRFEFDYYDGEGSAQEGGGAWPVCNFWLAIYYARIHRRAEAESTFSWVLEHGAPKYNGYLPEQIFEDERTGIYPLAWSHAMFVLACHELGYLRT